MARLQVAPVERFFGQGDQNAVLGLNVKVITSGARKADGHPDVPLTRQLLVHELTHVRQWQASPFVFPLRYVWYSIRHGYWGNPYEVEARRHEEDV